MSTEFHVDLSDTYPSDTTRRLLVWMVHDLPAGAPEILRWLLTGPRTLDELVTLREKSLQQVGSRVTHNEAQARHYAPRSVLHDLAAAETFVDYRDGAFHLTGEPCRPAVELYDQLARQSAHHLTITGPHRSGAAD